MTSITITPDPAVIDRHRTLTTEMTERVQQIADATVDAVVPTQGLRMIVNAAAQEGEPITDRVIMQGRGADGIMPLRVLDGAHQQIANKLDIPRKYYDRMLGSQPALLAENVNTWFNAEPKNRLLRMLKPITGTEHQRAAATSTVLNVRAFLGERYRALDHGALLNLLFSAERDGTASLIEALGARVVDYNLDEQRFHVRIATDAEDVLARFVAQQPALGGLSEIVSFGASIRNSETGHASLSVVPTCDIKRCTNVLRRTAEMLRIAHIGGGRNSEDDDGTGFMQTDTRRAENAATFLKVRDHVQRVFGTDARTAFAREIADAAGTPLELPPEVPVMRFLEGVGSKYDLREGELAILKDEYVNEVQQTGRATQWSVSQALTATARRIGEPDENGARAGHERATELSEYGWRVLKDSTSAFIKAIKRN